MKIFNIEITGINLRKKHNFFENMFFKWEITKTVHSLSFFYFISLKTLYRHIFFVNCKLWYLGWEIKLYVNNL